MVTESDTKKSFPDRRLERACQYVSDMWFPVNPALVARLRAAVKNTKSADMDSLVSEIQGDYALYMFCLRELCGLLQREGVKPPEAKTPLEMFRFGGIDRLRSILELSDKQRSPHSFELMSESQKRRIQDSIISASSVQALARGSKVDPQLGYSTGLLRQLGLTLIAWNYPSAYEKALSMLTEDTSLDILLTQVLGFSPAVLALALSHKWGLPRELCAALEFDIAQREDFEEALEVEAIGSMLANLCRVGEALARANNPQDYPSARKDWAKAQAEVASRLGPDGISIIQEAVAENCQKYTISSPGFFKPGKILDPESHIAEFLEGQLLASNPHVMKCEDALREKFIKLYEKISKLVSSDEALRFLVHQIIPESQFKGGCVFTIEPSSGMLVSQLKIGSPISRDTSPVPATASTSASDIITVAYNSDEPIIRNLTIDGHNWVQIAGLFGFNQRLGVLFLEMPENLYIIKEMAEITHFKAMAQALNDSLEIR